MVASEQDIAEQRARRNLVIIIALIAAVAIAGLFIILMRAAQNSGGSSPTLTNAIRPGSPEWDQYSKNIAVDEPEADEAKRALGDTVMTLRTTVRNFTGKTLTGLEIRAAVVDHQGKAVRERHVVFIPTETHPELAPNKTLPVAVVLDGMTDATDRANIQVQVTGFTFKQQ